jgi:hypothetical protein
MTFVIHDLCKLFGPPLDLVYTWITGNALAINISSNWVKVCNSGGAADGIIRFSFENFLGVALSFAHREHI